MNAVVISLHFVHLLKLFLFIY